ncbi:cyanophycinase [Pleurocapsa sp. PCC 7319]|uniref:cyanophycinase n=1 Tax=Pleurocapsa sp. PCC 7319 TaxID=118161 RepID=UPI0003477D2E|nr:cyanophycinase [Pleurocapsa sp. PCC 7319]
MINTEIKNQTTYSSQSTKNAILVIGGAEDKVHGKEILQTFFNLSGGIDAIIGIVPCASREPSLIGERYYRLFNDMGAKEIKVLDVRDRSRAEDSVYRNFVEDCTGIFLTGGDQLRLCGLLADTTLMNRIVERAQKREISLAGTSAGAAVMGRHMISGGSSAESPNRSLVDMAVGLGIIPEVLVDQHFYNRNRLARLLSAIAGYPQLIGIGIDEDTCAMFESDGMIQVIGKGTVTIVDPREMSYTNHREVHGNEPLSMHNLKLHILSHGDRYDLHKHLPLNRSIS